MNEQEQNTINELIVKIDRLLCVQYVERIQDPALLERIKRYVAYRIKELEKSFLYGMLHRLQKIELLGQAELEDMLLELKGHNPLVGTEYFRRKNTQKSL